MTRSQASATGYATDIIGVGCNLAPGHWARTRKFCAFGINNIPGIVPNYSQRTQVAAGRYVTAQLPAVSRSGGDKVFDIHFYSFSQAPRVQAYTEKVTAMCTCGDPVQLADEGDRSRGFLFHVKVTVSPATGNGGPSYIANAGMKGFVLVLGVTTSASPVPSTKRFEVALN
jgi:hypothetical protein